MTDETTTTKKAGLSPIEVGAGAGAAVITAFASAYLGTAGTLTGAAIASVVGTVSTAVLRNSARTSAQRLKETTTRLRETQVHHAGVTDVRPVEAEDVDPYGTQFFAASDWIDSDTPAGRDRTGRPGLLGPTGADPGSAWTRRPGGAGPDTTGIHGSPAGPPFRPGAAGPVPRVTGQATGSAAPWSGSTRRWPGTGTGAPGTGATTPVTGLNEPVGSGTGSGDPAGLAGVAQALRRVRGRWVVVGAGALAAFALALGAITGIEAVAGKPLAGLAGQESGGGTTIGRATGADRGSNGSTPSPTPAPTPGGGTTPTAPASGNAPSVTPTEPSGPPAGSPTPAPSQGPTQAPSQAPTQAPTQASGGPNNPRTP